MTTPAITTNTPDTPDARRYNRIRRWLGVADVGIGALLLVVLLTTGWTGDLRDLTYRASFQNYALAVAMYVLVLILIVKILGMGLDYYGFRLEHRFHLSNMRFSAWIKDELKEFLVGVVLTGIVA